MNNDPLNTAILFLLIPALVFAFCAYYINRRAARQATAAVEAESEPLLPPPLPLLDLNMDIIVTDAAGRRWKVHFGVMDVQMVEDE